MEWLRSNWLTLVPIFGAVCAWLWTVGVQALTLRQQQNQREWARFGELVKILNNPEGKHGKWDQMAAVLELNGLKSKKKFVLRIATDARAYWAANGASEALVTELDALISEMDRVTSAAFI